MKLLIVTVLCFLVGVNAQSSRIINGENVSGVIPFYAYVELRRLPGVDGPYFGGGTIVSQNAILTVAQNVRNFQSWRVGVGAVQVSQLQWFNVLTTHEHPEFHSETLAHNIAILRLVSPIPVTPNTFAISRLPPSSTFPTGGQINIIVGFGFGATHEQPTILQQAPLTALTAAECGTFYPHLISNNQLDNHFCAQNTVTGANICAGDQGGPIFNVELNLLIGIQSFNRVADCSSVHAQPAAFLRVARYSDFINSHL